MQLEDVKQREQFEEYYKQKGLKETDEKIKDIKEATGIDAVRHCHGTASDDVLAGLEDSVLYGSWRDFD
ncbi:MAG: hypothetical protein FWG02_10420 [Holophagaceae bacterium]|nr:hypothetical protein [Holophagaceae bacterium]